MLRPGVVLVFSVAVALVLSLVFLGVFTGGLPHGSPVGTSAASFASARAVADQFAARYGTWSLIEALGWAFTNGSYFQFNSTTSNPNCTVTILAGTVPSNLSVPPFRGNLSSGVATVWIFAYVAPGIGSLLGIYVLSGQIALAAVDSPSCSQGLFAHVQGITSPVVDTTEAAAAAAAVGGAAFLRAHSTGVSLAMFLVGGFAVNASSNWPMWHITWSTCSTSPTSSAPSAGYTFTAEVNATTGAVVPFSAVNETCGSGAPSTSIGDALTPGPPSLYQGPGTTGTIASQGCRSGDYCFSVPIEVASMNITPNDFTTSVENTSTGIIIMTTVGFAILNASGAVIVYSTGPMESAWTPGVGNADTQLAAGMTITVDIGPGPPTSPNYLGLVLSGQGPFADSLLVLSL